MKSEYRLYSIDDIKDNCVAIVRSDGLNEAIQKTINLLGFETVQDFMSNFPGHCYIRSNQFYVRMIMIGWKEKTIKGLCDLHSHTSIAMCLNADYFKYINKNNVESYVYSCVNYPTIDDIKENSPVIAPIVKDDSNDVWYCTDWNDYCLRKG